MGNHSLGRAQTKIECKRMSDGFQVQETNWKLGHYSWLRDGAIGIRNTTCIRLIAIAYLVNHGWSNLSKFIWNSLAAISILTTEQSQSHRIADCHIGIACLKWVDHAENSFTGIQNGRSALFHPKWNKWTEPQRGESCMHRWLHAICFIRDKCNFNSSVPYLLVHVFDSFWAKETSLLLGCPL